MPNYVVNNIYLKGPQEEIDKVIKLLGKDIKNPEEQIDFNNVIKMPESLNLVAGSVAENYIAAYLKTLTDKDKVDIAKKMGKVPARYEGDYLKKYYDAFIKTLKPKDMEYLNSRLSKDFKELNPASIEEVGKAYIENIINHGADTWYDWSVNNWGCKWNACESEIEDNVISFHTAWSGSFPITETLSEMFPTLSFTHEFADEDIGYNCGRIVFTNGEVVSEYIPEGEEATRFACKIWGFDVTDYGLLPDGVEKMTLEEVIEPYNLELKIDGNEVVLIDNGKPGSSYDGLTFAINETVISSILEAIDTLTDEAYDEFCDDLSKKGINPHIHDLEGMLTYVPTDTANYGLMYNICHSDEIMTIKALEKKSLENVISDATKACENTEPKTTEKEDTKEL